MVEETFVANSDQVISVNGLDIRADIVDPVVNNVGVAGRRSRNST
jgi:hypothetical protein